MGSFHAKRAMDPSVAVAEDETIKHWLAVEDMVLVRAVMEAMGPERVHQIVAHFEENKMWLRAAKLELAMCVDETTLEHGTRALALIDEHKLASDEAQQLALDVLCNERGNAG